jgi:branched-chain amino acid transport system permease protein
MLYLQVLLNGIVLGCIYACVATGFSLVWGVLNVINLMHGTFIVLGSYLAWWAYTALNIAPWTAL